MKKIFIERYADVLIKTGLNLQVGQSLYLVCPTQCSELAGAIVKQGKALGLSDIAVQWVDAVSENILDTMQNYDEHKKTIEDEYAMYTTFCQRGYAYLKVYAPDFIKSEKGQGIPPLTELRNNMAANLRQSFAKAGNGTCIACGATREWAGELFAHMGEDEARDKLWDLIFEVTRAKEDDPVAKWKTHSRGIVEKGIKMTDYRFEKLHLQSSKTDLWVELPKNHIWGGGEFPNGQGHMVVPNIPTEELAAVPYKYGVNGVVHSEKPLNYMGAIVDNFELEFKDGKVIKYKAEKGEEILKKILETDSGSAYLGEVAIVPFDSLINNTNTVFLCTLFDENASCHMALGRVYGSSIKHGEHWNTQEQEAAGLNQSSIHVDFMVGGRDLSITGHKTDGTSIKVFENGAWII